MSALFGPGGNSLEFKLAGKRSTVEAPEWLYSYGLDAYEYEAGNGISGGDAVFAAIGAEARRYGIKMSFHTPYFISLSGIDPEKRLKSIKYITDSLHAAELLGADTIVIHSGSAGKLDRREAMALAADTLSRLMDTIGTTDIRLGLETMGKQNQLGTLSEVIELCRIAPEFHPVVDFGHLNARVCGGAFPDADSYRRVFGEIADSLGGEYAERLHCHFSMIEWTEKGEKRHLTFADGGDFGPHFEPLAEAIVRDGLSPRIISESAGSQSEDAMYMKKLYKSLKGE